MNNFLTLKLFEFSKKTTRPLNIKKKISFDVCLKKKYKFIKIWFKKKKRWKPFKIYVSKLQHNKYFIKRIRGPYKLYMRYVSSFRFCGFHRWDYLKVLFKETVYNKYSQRIRKIFRKYKNNFLRYFLRVRGLAKYIPMRYSKKKRNSFYNNRKKKFIALKKDRLTKRERAYKERKRRLRKEFILKRYIGHPKSSGFRLKFKSKFFKRYLLKHINFLLAKNSLKEDLGQYTYSDLIKNNMRRLLRLPLKEEEAKEEGEDESEDEDEDEEYKSNFKAVGNISFFNIWITFFHRRNLTKLNKIRMEFRKKDKHGVIKHWKHILKQKIFLIFYLYNFYSFRAISTLTKSTENISYIKEPKVLRFNFKTKMVSEKIPELKIKHPNSSAKISELTVVAITYREFGAFLLLLKKLYSFLNCRFENSMAKKKKKVSKNIIKKIPKKRSFSIKDLIENMTKITRKRKRSSPKILNEVNKKKKEKSLNSRKLVKENPFFLKYDIGESSFKDYRLTENIFSTQNILAPRLIRYFNDYLVELPLSRNKVKKIEISKKKVYLPVCPFTLSRHKVNVRSNVDYAYKYKSEYRFYQSINYKILKKEIGLLRKEGTIYYEKFWSVGIFPVSFFMPKVWPVFVSLGNYKMKYKFIMAFHEKVYREHITNKSIYKTLFTPYNIWIFFFNYALNYYLLSKLYFSFLNYLFYIILEKFLRISHMLRIKNLELCYDFMKLGDNSRYYLGIRPHTFITTFNRRVQRGSL